MKDHLFLFLFKNFQIKAYYKNFFHENVFLSVIWIKFHEKISIKYLFQSHNCSYKIYSLTKFKEPTSR